MILQKIEVTNFRPFYGTQEIVFSVDKTKNTTLIHGENGTGKTALLNALIWAFHEDFTGNFNNPEMLVNKHAIKIDNCNQCDVTVYFRFKNDDYRLTRKYTQSTKKSTLDVFKINDTKNSEPVPQKEQFINQVFPKGMSKYFFFAGEFATNFEKESSKTEAKKSN